MAGKLIELPRSGALIEGVDCREEKRRCRACGAVWIGEAFLSERAKARFGEDWVPLRSECDRRFAERRCQTFSEGEGGHLCIHELFDGDPV